MSADELVVQHCEEEQVPEEDVVRNSYNSENGDQTRYPSECVLEEWKQGMQRTSEGKLELQQGHFTSQLIFSYKQHIFVLLCVTFSLYNMCR